MIWDRGFVSSNLGSVQCCVIDFCLIFIFHNEAILF